MKCPNTECGNERILEEDFYCGECGTQVRTEFSPKWKWGSMIVSLVLLFIFWIVIEYSYDFSDWANKERLLVIFLFGFPATIFLMYKERTTKINYKGMVWLLFPLLILITGFGTDYVNMHIICFLSFAIPAIFLDYLTLEKMNKRI